MNIRRREGERWGEKNLKTDVDEKIKKKQGQMGNNIKLSGCEGVENRNFGEEMLRDHLANQ